MPVYRGVKTTCTKCGREITVENIVRHKSTIYCLNYPDVAKAKRESQKRRTEGRSHPNAPLTSTRIECPHCGSEVSRRNLARHTRSLACKPKMRPFPPLRPRPKSQKVKRKMKGKSTPKGPYKLQVECPRCGSVILAKNLARHKRGRACIPHRSSSVARNSPPTPTLQEVKLEVPDVPQDEMSSLPPSPIHQEVQIGNSAAVEDISSKREMQRQRLLRLKPKAPPRKGKKKTAKLVQCPKCGQSMLKKSLIRHTKRRTCMKNEQPRSHLPHKPLKVNCLRCGKEVLKKNLERHMNGQKCKSAQPRLPLPEPVTEGTSTATVTVAVTFTPTATTSTSTVSTISTLQPKENKGNRERVRCPGCGKEMYQKSLGNHIWTVCKGASIRPQSLTSSNDSFPTEISTQFPTPDLPSGTSLIPTSVPEGESTQVSLPEIKKEAPEVPESEAISIPTPVPESESTPITLPEVKREAPEIPTSASESETPKVPTPVQESQTPVIPTSVPTSESTPISLPQVKIEAPEIPTSAKESEAPAIPTSVKVSESTPTSLPEVKIEAPEIPTSVRASQAPVIATSVPASGSTPITLAQVKIEAPEIPTSTPASEAPVIATSVPESESTPITLSDIKREAPEIPTSVPASDQLPINLENIKIEPGVMEPSQATNAANPTNSKGETGMMAPPRETRSGKRPHRPGTSGTKPKAMESTPRSEPEEKKVEILPIDVPIPPKKQNDYTKAKNLTKTKIQGMLVKGDFDCTYDDCCFMPESFAEYKHHIMKIHPLGVGTWCQHCGLRFFEPLNLDLHRELFHRKPEPCKWADLA